MDQQQQSKFRDYLLLLTPWLMTSVTGICVYMFTQLQDTREKHLQYQKYVAENYVTKNELYRDVEEIKLSLRDIRDEIIKSRNGG